MNKGYIFSAAILGSLMLAAAPAQADVLLLEKIKITDSTNVPRTGLSMEQVSARFGLPADKRPAVGDPPITRWIYPTFSVFFEYDLVIDSVVHPQVAGLTDPDS